MWTRVSPPDLTTLRTEGPTEGQTVSPWQEGRWEEGNQAQMDLSSEVLHPSLQCPGLCWPTQPLSKLSLKKMKSSSTAHIPPSSLHAGREGQTICLPVGSPTAGPHRQTQTSLSSFAGFSPDKSWAFPFHGSHTRLHSSAEHLSRSDSAPRCRAGRKWQGRTLLLPTFRTFAGTVPCVLHWPEFCHPAVPGTITVKKREFWGRKKSGQ